ncbi:hypothetical protein BHE90_015799 [Fusarium euwallaceae]|uniref:Myb-like DNA-binding domain-containing protein n=4 Tax=Fusarium solani species complex TaxID=232080 RepID=A0A3M2RID1_9HYPO|nr:hypothetical protein CDV36_014408 [Fusarium kuroshium]RSL59456.1 hypothetical protein CEP51_013918 [Fusarium floridanum]RSM09967.1 hypothetical protein CDV31_007485 [Fusarium ambrosium]RTE69808.1 hypothetical protein BHE90_015799 [Fusarium euwallaceae]
MSKQDPADQVKFLVSCIGHTSNGRPDFQAVAEELAIVSKAAAQKRYERMLKAHGISRPGALAGGDSAPATPTKRKAKAEGAGSAKKKPARGKAKKESDEDEEAEAKPKPKAKRGKQAEKVKKEEDSDSGESRGSSLTEPPAASAEEASS